MLIKVKVFLHCSWSARSSMKGILWGAFCGKANEVRSKRLHDQGPQESHSLTDSLVMENDSGTGTMFSLII